MIDSEQPFTVRDVTWWLLSALVGVGTLIRIPQLSHSLNEAFGFRQTQTAFVIQQYAADGVNLLSTPLPVFGRDSDVPFEFPLFQALGALLMHTGLPSDGAGRLLALVSFQATALMLALVLLRWHGKAVAVVAVALFEFLPFGLFWGTASLIDFFSVALALTMVYFLDRWFSDGSALTLVAGSLAAVLAFMVKPTTAPSWSLLVLGSAAMVMHRVGWRLFWKRMVMGLAMGPGVGLVAAATWTAYADSIKRHNPLTEFLLSSALRDWNFGSQAQRADPNSYLMILNRVIAHIAGPGMLAICLGVLSAVFIARPQHRLSVCAWLLVAISGPLVFLNLYVIHDYYLIAIYPAVVTLMAIGIVWATRALPGLRWQRFAAAALAVAAVAITTFPSPGARGDLAALSLGKPESASSIGIRAKTPPGSRLIMIGCDWNPTTLYYAQREGVMFREHTPRGFWESEPIADYPFLFSCKPGLKSEPWLPPGYTVVAAGVSGLFRVVRKT